MLSRERESKESEQRGAPIDGRLAFHLSSFFFFSSHLEPVDAQQARKDALLEARAEHDGVVGLVHGFWRRKQMKREQK